MSIAEVKAGRANVKALKSAYTAFIGQLVDKVNSGQAITKADWTNLITGKYDPVTLAMNDLAAKIDALPDDPVQPAGALPFYQTKHGCTMSASGPGDIKPGGARLYDQYGEQSASWYEFDKALPDGNFTFVKNGTPFTGIGFTSAPYAGVTMRMNRGTPVIINKAGAVVLGTAIPADDKTALLG